jgi:hypothetical protein
MAAPDSLPGAAFILGTYLVKLARAAASLS